MGKRYFDDAVTELDEFIQSKAVHSTKAICEKMQSLCRKGFANQDDQTDFAQLCRNFEIHAATSHKKSWGKKQFEAWWNNQYDDDDSIDILPNLEEKKRIDEYDEVSGKINFVGRVGKSDTETSEELTALFDSLPDEGSEPMESMNAYYEQSNPFDVQNETTEIHKLKEENKQLRFMVNNTIDILKIALKGLE